MIELRNVHKRFGSKKVLQGISLTINPGEITSISGMNGSGKTTFIQCLMHLLPVDKGEILLNGKTMSFQDYEHLSYIPDTITMPRNLTIRQAMEYMESFYENWNQEKANSLLQFFHLNPDEKIKEHSKGNQAKINILLGLAIDADYYLMDEPFSGIDVFSKEHILEVFTTDLVEGKGVLIATHHIDEVEFVVDRVVLLDDGIIQRDFYTEEIRSEGKSVIDIMREVYQP